MLVKEIISEVRNSVRAVSNDMWIPAKYIHSKLKGFAALFIKREADDKRLFKYTEVWSTIHCLKLEEKDLVECCNVSIPSCKKVMVSKVKLPEIYSTRFGYLINVSSVDYDKDYLQTTPQQYKYTRNREYNDKSKRYFWIENGHLVIPDVMVEGVRVRAMFIDKGAVAALNCDDTGSNVCMDILENDFVAPEHLLQDIKNAATLDIIKTVRGIVPDELTNNNEQEKTNPTKI